MNPGAQPNPPDYDVVDFPEIARSRGRAIAVAAVSGVAILALLCAIASEYEWLVERPPWILLLLSSLFATALALFVLAVNAWSITLLRVLYRKVIWDRKALRDRQKGAKRLLGNRACGYCGKDRAPILCGDCDSIQWGDLGDLHSGRLGSILGNGTRLRWHWAWAAFIAHHRFKLLAALLSAVAFGLLPFAFELSNRRVVAAADLRKMYREQGKAVIESTIEYRSALQYLEHHCHAERNDTLPSNCSRMLHELARSFLVVSWNAPPVIAHLERERCSAPGTALEIAACQAADRADVIAFLDAKYRAYVDAWSARLADEAEESHARRLNQAGAELYVAGLQVGCVLFAFSHGASLVAEPGRSIGESAAHAQNACLRPMEALERHLVHGQPSTGETLAWVKRGLDLPAAQSAPRTIDWTAWDRRGAGQP